ncbi:recombinase family protein [Nocardioides zeae]|uniref:Recombinase family protein n=1 Tax=Nocardioides imazamoxiresistens TaxID=3231893 RepID=A0ABU3PQS7_9ACTN|nr:recombinase family protein [Nocardioides zeae]MDT9591580.1 recombinase family protein [Nocardioides zeae]
MTTQSRAAVYVRISQDREGAGLGVQRQEADCRALADKLGMTVLQVYVDNDTSAYNGRARPQYLAMLEDVKRGKIDAVLVWHTDRLHRSTRDLEAYVEAAGHIPTYTVKAGLLDLATPSGRLVARQLGAVAQYESEHKSERQRRKADELAAKGLPLGGGRPFGYESDGLTIRESEAKELRQIITRVLAGDSLKSIIRDLNEREVLTTRGGAWGYTSVRALLLRERNCGRMVHRGQVVGKAAWEPIVSETDHDAVVAVLSDPKRRTTTSPARKHLLSGIARCHCGAKVKVGAVSPKGKRYEIYKCPETGGGHVGRTRSKVEDAVMERVMDVLDVITINGDDRSPALEAERTRVQTELDDAAALYPHAITAAQLAAISTRLTQRLEEITEELSQVTRGTALEGTAGLSREQFEALPLDRKRKIIDALVTVTIHPAQRGRHGGHGVEVKVRDGGRFGFRVSRAMRDSVRAAAS